MAPSFETSEDQLGRLRVDLLRSAVDLYLGFAYEGRSIPEAVSRRLIWRGDCSTQDLLKGSPFEHAGVSVDHGSPIFALRLGNARYPHMKLQIQPWPNEAGFMLSVNTHDQATGLALGADEEAFRALQAENQRLKEAIEQAWDEAGLPTFLRYLRDYISSQVAEGSGGASGDSASAVDCD